MARRWREVYKPSRRTGLELRISYGLSLNLDSDRVGYFSPCHSEEEAKRKCPAMMGLCILAVLGCGSDPLNHVPGMDPWLDGNPTELAHFAINAEEGPVVMINLLKSRTEASDGSGSGA